MSERIYAWLLKLYPARFRDEYAASALQLFRDRSRVERGPFRRFRFWLDIVTDLAISLAREHWRRDAGCPEIEGSFHISKEAVTALTKRAVASAMVVNIFIAIGLTAGWLGNANRILLFAVYFAFAILPVLKLLSVRQNKEHWRSYQLILEADRLRQKQYGSDVTILKSQVIRINEDQYGLRVFGLRGDGQAAMGQKMDKLLARELASWIWIPAGLTGYEHVREQIFHWTDRIGRFRSPWLLQNIKPVFLCAASLLPAILLVHSTSWFLMMVAVYYGMVLLPMATNIIWEPRRPSDRRMWRRFKNSCRKPPFLVLLIFPIVRIVLPL